MQGNRASRKLRVLVVEDYPDEMVALGLLLRLSGHDVLEAADGAGALRLAAESRPDAVLLDVGLPGADGCEVARQLRRLPGLGGAVVVAVTGFGRPQDVERCRGAGFDHHLLKPCEPDALERLLGSCPERAVN